MRLIRGIGHGNRAVDEKEKKPTMYIACYGLARNNESMI